jgi:hypothetical protein
MPKQAPHEVPNEVVVAKLSIEAASLALESLFEKAEAVPRAEKMIVSDKVREACQRLKAAQEVLAELEKLALEPA